MAKVYEYNSINAPTLLYGSYASSAEIIIDLDFAETLTNDQAIAAIGITLTLTYDGISYDFKVSGLYDDSSSTTGYITEEYMNYYSTNTTCLYVEVKDITYLDSVKEELESLGFNATELNEEASTVLDYIDLGTTVLTAVSLIAMIVSAIMIIIVMYISVIERTQEIGILRSIGARKLDIANVFNAETTIIGIISGVLGIIIAWILDFPINAILHSINSQVPPNFAQIAWWHAFVLIALAIVLNVLAGFIPSIIASKKDPVVALRSSQ